MSSAAESLLDQFMEDIQPLQLRVIVFGGQAISLHLDALPEGEDARETRDVDCVPSSVHNAIAMHELENTLHNAGWTPHIDKVDGGVKRNLFAKISPSGVNVDFMPIFSLNQEDAIAICAKDAQSYPLPSGTTLRVLTAAGLLAAKLQAHRDRGSDAPMFSHDLEDIALLLACCSQLEASVQGSPPAVKELISAEARLLEADEQSMDALESHFPRGCDIDAAMDLLSRLTG